MRRVNNPLAALTGEDVLSFEKANVRPNLLPKTQASIRNYLELQHTRRWRRLQADYRWLQSELASMDLNPEEARFLLG